ncbi:MAG: TonB-dependent receptor [Flavobacteriales bacterium]|nr:TonB-dependent receptor [Flavobacteriales bacterium]
MLKILSSALFVLFAMLTSAITMAQTTVTVVDASSGDVLPGAVVHCRQFSGQTITGTTTDYRGIAVIGKEWLAAGQSCAVEVVYVGYASQTDTISGGSARTIALTPVDSATGTVVVTGQASPQVAARSIHRIRVIDEKRINSLAAINLEDVLQQELNIRISQDGVLGSGMSMQGVGGQNVKILIDGIPVIGRLDGNIDLSQINLQNVERIEIVEGPLSVQYGSNALAGTINIITRKKSNDRVHVALDSYTENIGTFNNSITATAGLKSDFTLGAAAGRNFFDGWNDNDAFFPSFQKTPADSTRQKQWNPRGQNFGRIWLNREWQGWNANYRFEVFDELITNRGVPRAPYNETAFDDLYATLRMDHALNIDRQIGKGHYFRFVAGFNDYTRTKNTYLRDLTNLDAQLTPAADDQDTTTFRTFMSRASVAFNTDSAFTWQCGYDLSHEQGTGLRLAQAAGGMGDYAVFADAEWKAADVLSVKPALRAGYNTVYSMPLIPSLHIKYNKGNTVVRASYAHGFRAPALKELYFFFVDINHNIVGNSALQAEQSVNYTINVQHKHNIGNALLGYEAGAFFNRIENMITLAQITDVQYSYVNIGHFETRGITLGADVYYKRVRLALGYAYTGRLNGLPEETTGDTYLYSGEARASFSVSTKDQWTFNTFVKHTGELPGFALDDEGNLIQSSVGSFTMLDVNVGKSFFSEQLTIAMGGKNLLDVTNINSNVTGSGGTHSQGATSLPVSTGRTVFIKFNYHWKK